MPQASDEVRALMASYFGDDGIDLYPPLECLKSLGWTDGAGWLCYPEGKLRSEVTKKEWDCVDFLCDEWDFAFDAEDQWDTAKTEDAQFA